MARFVYVSARLFVAITVALVLSAIANIACVFVFRSGSSPARKIFHDLLTPEDMSFTPPSTLERAIRTAAMTTVASPRFGLEADDEDWENLLPYGGGFVHDSTTGEFHLLSQYHQVHCLRAFRKTFNDLVNTNRTLAHAEVRHIEHCMIYMRQIIMCLADVTLEPTHKQRAPDGHVVDAVTGVGVTHRCRDWKQVWDYAENSFRGWEATQNATTM